jgi:hypothetical protein
LAATPLICHSRSNNPVKKKVIIVAETQEAPTGLTIHTQTFLDVFRDIANEHEWCDTAEDVLRNRLDLEFQPYGDDFCCSRHSSDQRFLLADGKPTELDAPRVAALIAEAVENGELGTLDAQRLAGLLPDELAEAAALPKPPTYKVTFTFTRPRPYSSWSTERSRVRDAAEVLYSGRNVTDVKIERTH